MIRISAKAEYAARAVLHLSLNAHACRPAQLDEIAAHWNIPREFLVQVMSALIKRGIVTSKRGARGGYVLSQSPQDVMLRDVIEAVDGSVNEFRCETKGFDQCVGEDCCVFRPIWEDMVRVVSGKLAGINFQQLNVRARVASTKVKRPKHKHKRASS